MPSIPKLWVVGAAAVGVVAVTLVAIMMLQPPGDLLPQAEFTLDRITPNADNDDDITEFRYELTRTANITLAFEDESGERFVFRDNERRVPGTYSVLFSGVVDGFQNPGESWEGILETRLLPDGLYTWTLSATDEDGDSETRTGTLEIAEADTELPLIVNFEVGPQIFTPNQDGIDDRVRGNIFLAKPAQLTIFLESADDDTQTFIPLREGIRETGEAGSYEFDYDGGVDQGFRPPANGTYTLTVEAQDDEGQRFVRSTRLTIQDSGLPQVEIVSQQSGGTVCFETRPYDEAYFTNYETVGETIPLPDTVCSERTTLSLQAGDMLVFNLLVRNYGDTPIRTGGPFPGTVYDFEQQASTMGELEESGLWRVGIECETSLISFPWRWAIAPEEDLTVEFNKDTGRPYETYYYLEPGERGRVWGAIRITEIVDARNPQRCWAGLIHEDVGIPPLQGRVGEREIKLEP